MCLAALCAAPASGQAVRRPAESVEEAFDSADAFGRARREQARFERRRIRHLPPTWGGSGGDCDEIVGRFCTWYDEEDWLPGPEASEIVEMRDALLAYLDSVQDLLPGDGWVLGQRVWYRSEAGRWEEALRTARTCGAEAWWCAALEGFALHGLGRFEAAEGAFERALAAMEEDRARRWRIPRRAVEGDVRDLLDDGEGDRDRRLAWLWRLADPLYLAPGNDRRTEHYARWTVSTIRERSRNPFQISWGRDLEELTVRHGWEIGWERQRPRDFTSMEGVVGHKHPEGRDFMPRATAVREPGRAEPADLAADRSSPRSLYAPAYAPVLLPLDGQVAVFPRAERFAVLATQHLPADTTWHRDGPDVRPWMEPGPAVHEPPRAGLFLVPAGDGAPGAVFDAGARALRATRTGSTEGAIVLEAPAGAWILSVEAWSPPERRAGRHRQGLLYRPVPPDVATLSDLVLVRGGGGDPVTLEQAARRALVRVEIGREDAIGVVWELGGLGRAPEAVTYALSVERVGRGLLRRLGETVGLVGQERPLSLAWEEPGPDTPRHVLRGVDLALPELEPGEYGVRLSATVPGRTPLEAETRFRVR